MKRTKNFYLYAAKIIAVALGLFLCLSAAGVFKTGRAQTLRAEDEPNGIQAQIDSAQSGDTVTLTEDCAVSLNVGADKDITLDLAGYEISATLTNGGTLTLTDSAGNGKIAVTNGSATEATTAAVINNGALTVLGGVISSQIINASSASNAVALVNNGTVKSISGGKLYAEHSGKGYATALRNSADSAIVQSISGGEFSALVTNATAGNTHLAYGIFNEKGSISEISGGKITGKTTATQWAFGILNSANIGTISGGEFISVIEHSKNAPNAIALSNDKTVNAITGGTFYAVSTTPSGSTYAVRSRNAGVIKAVTGGAYYVNKTAESNYLFAASHGTISLGAGYSLSAASQTTQYRYALCGGETYSEEYLEGDNVMTGRVKNADGETVKEYVLTGTERGDAASIGDRLYASVSDAVAASSEGDTVKVLKSAQENVTVPQGKNVTVDLCGKRITGTLSIFEGATLKLADNAGGGMLFKSATASGLDALIYNRGTLELKNVSMRIEGRSDTAEADGIYNYEGASLTVLGGRLRALSYGKKWSHGIVNAGVIRKLSDFQIESVSVNADTSSNIVALSVIGGGEVKEISGGTIYAQSCGAGGSAVGIRTQGTGNVLELAATVKAVVNSAKKGSAKAYGVYTEGVGSRVKNVSGGKITARNYTGAAYGVFNKGECGISGGYIEAVSSGAHAVHNAGTLDIEGGAFVASEGGEYVYSDNGTENYRSGVKLIEMECAIARYAAADGDVVIEQLDGEKLIGINAYRDGELLYEYGDYGKSGYYLDKFTVKGDDTSSVDKNDFASMKSSATVYASYAASPVYFFLGSSVTYGHANNGSSFVNEISSMLNATCVKEAVSGTTLADNGANSYVSRMLSNFDKNAKAEKLIVQLSTNDATQNANRGTISSSMNIEDFDRKTTLGAIEYIIAYARQTWNCGVTFYTNPKYDNAGYASLVTDLYAIREKWGIGIVDFYNYVDMEELPAQTLSSFMADAIHPNALGYKWMGEVFAEYLRKDFAANHAGKII